jgi:DNA-binding transcriptional ArsR family regulator
VSRVQGGFFQGQRRFARMLEDGDISPTAYGLLNYLGQAGADRQEEGFATSYDFLARLFDVSEKTITRHLERLRDLGEVDYKVGRGRRRPFRVRLTEQAIVPPLRTRLEGAGSDAVSEMVSEPVSEPTSDVTSAQVDPYHSWEEGSVSDRTSKVGAHTHSEISSNIDTDVVDEYGAEPNQKLVPVLEELLTGFELRPSQRDEIAIAYGEDPALVAELIDEARAGDRPPALLTNLVRNRKQVARDRAGRSALKEFLAKNGGRWPTGTRMARGTHSFTYVPDPLGYEKAVEYEVDWGRPTEAEVIAALRAQADEEGTGGSAPPP